MYIVPTATMESNISMTHLIQHLALHPASQQLLALVTNVDAILRNKGFVLRFEQVVFLLRDHHHCYLSFSKIYRPIVDAYLFEALGFLKFGDLSSISAPLSVFAHPPGGFNFSQDSFETLDEDSEVTRPRDNVDDTTLLEEDEQGKNVSQSVFSETDEKTENPPPEISYEDCSQDLEDQGRKLYEFEDFKRRFYFVNFGSAIGGVNSVCNDSRRYESMKNYSPDTKILRLGSEERLVFDRGKLTHPPRSFGL